MSNLNGISTIINEVSAVMKQTDKLLAERHEAYGWLSILQNSPNSTLVPITEMMLFLLPGRIKFALLDIKNIQEQIDFNIAYTEMLIANAA